MGTNEGYVVRRVNELRHEGWDTRQLRRGQASPSVAGVRVLTPELELPDREARVAQALAVTPTGGVLSGWAAAAMWGVPSDFLDGTVDGVTTLPVDFSVPRDEGTYRRRGVRLRFSPVPQEDVVLVGGTAVTSPRRTAFDLARWSRTGARALAMLDLSVRHELIDLPSFTAYVSALRRLHGLRRVREVLPSTCGAAESVPESELRWHWLATGLPRPHANVEVYDRRGLFVGRVDLLDPESGVGAEYQGFWHRRDLAAEDDAVRFERFRRMNLTIVEVWKDDMVQPAVTGMLNDAYRRARARDVRLDAWRCRIPGNSG